MEVRRGVIQNRERKRQIVDFHSLLWDKITPTDIDGVIDFQNKLYIYFELKYGDANMPYGQRLAIERIIDSHENGGTPACGIVAQHDVGNPEDDIDAALCIVTEYRWRYAWHKPQGTTSLRQAIDRVRELVL